MRTARKLRVHESQLLQLMGHGVRVLAARRGEPDGVDEDERVVGELDVLIQRPK